MIKWILTRIFLGAVELISNACDSGGHHPARFGQSIEPSGTRGMVSNTATGNGRSYISASATLIQYDEDVKGPIDSAITDESLSEMQQSVFISTDNIMDNSSSNSIVSGDFLEISGIRDAKSTLQAIILKEKCDVTHAYKVRGVISQLNEANHTFVFGKLRIDYSVAFFYDFSRSSFSNGDLLEVKDRHLQYKPGSLYLVATKIQRFRKALVSADRASLSYSSKNSPKPAKVEAQAYVSEKLADDPFQLESLSVRIMPNTRFRDGERSQLAVNSRVEIEGSLNVAGELQAGEIKFDDSFDHTDPDDIEFLSSESSSSRSGSDDGTEVELMGVVGARDAVNGSVAIDGIGSSTELEYHQNENVNRNSFLTWLIVGTTVVSVKWNRFTHYREVPHEIAYGGLTFRPISEVLNKEWWRRPMPVSRLHRSFW